jgi:hypothetical protein
MSNRDLLIRQRAQNRNPIILEDGTWTDRIWVNVFVRRTPRGTHYSVSTLAWPTSDKAREMAIGFPEEFYLGPRPIDT